MNIALAIKYLYPESQPQQDFIVQDNGAEPVVREGAEEKGLVRYEIKSLDYGGDGEVIEEPLEGVHYRYGIDYNLLTEGEDYDLVERGQYIAAWNLEEPQPTEEELQVAWVAYQEAEANKPPEMSEVEQLRAENTELKLALTELAEAQEADKTEMQLALAEIAGLIGGE